MPDNITAPPRPGARLTVLFHNRLDQIIDQEHQPGLTRQERERLAGLHRQVKRDIASIRYGQGERGYEARARVWSTLLNFVLPIIGSHMGHTFDCQARNLHTVKPLLPCRE